MDNISLIPEKFYQGVDNVKSICELEMEITNRINKLNSIAKEVNIDITPVKREIDSLFIDARVLYSKLIAIKNIVMNIDSNANYSYKKDDYVNDLDKLKNTNNNTGANKSLDAESALQGKEKLLDKLKTSNGNVDADKSLNTTSILDTLKTKEGVNLVLDSLKDSGSSGADKSLNVVSILNKEM